MVNRPPSPTNTKNSASAASSVQVVVRLRPLNEQEKKHGTLPVVSASTADRTVTLIKEHVSLGTSKCTYKFDQVFTAFSTQREVFEATLQPVIRDVLQGFESTVFAYGQTGTGKTHTMEGNLLNPDEFGVIPRSATAIFDALENNDNNKKGRNIYKTLDSTVTVSFLEIYNEELCDLLADNNSNSSISPRSSPSKGGRDKLVIMEGKQGPFCRGLSERRVESADEVLALMRQAQQQRQVGETNMNKQSSRSHCIFTIKVQATRESLADGSVLQITGKLHCVDLAGSECAKSANLQTRTTTDPEQAARERERLNINRSLLTLGRVVSMLKENATGGGKKRNVRIPYRDSKLTRILQESLGGRCKTCLIATLSPSVTAIEESLSTLNYAQAANGIVNKPVNSSLLKHSGSGLSLTSSGSFDKSEANTVEHWHEMECRLSYMQSQVEEAQQALGRMHLKQQDLVDRATAAEEACAHAKERVTELEAANTNLTLQLESQVEENKRLSEGLATTQAKLTETNTALEAQVDENHKLSEKLSTTEKTLFETIAVLQATQKTEQNLTNEGKALLNVLEDAENECSHLHQELTKHRNEEVERKAATQTFVKVALENFQSIHALVANLQSSHQAFHSDLRKQSGDLDEIQNIFSAENKELLENLSQEVKDSIMALKKHLTDELVANLSDNSDAVIKNISTLKQNALDAKSTLSKSCLEVQTKLDAAAEQLCKSMGEEYQQASATLLDELTKGVGVSKQHLADISFSLTEALASAQKSRNENTKALQLLTENWKDSFFQTSTNIQSLSNTRTEKIAQVLEVLSQEQHSYHEQVDSMLKKQRSFIDASKVSQTKRMQDQKQLLSHQKESLKIWHNDHQTMCKSIIENVMTGVQELMSTQMSALMKRQTEDFMTLCSGNEHLVNSNEEVASSLSSVVDTIKNENGALQQHATKIRDNDAKAILEFQETQSTTLHGIQSLCERHLTDANEFVSVFSSHLHENEKKDTDLTRHINKEFLKSNEKLQSQLVDGVLCDAERNISLLSSCNSQSREFFRTDFVDCTQKSMDEEVKKPIQNVFSDLTNGLQNISAQVKKGADKVRTDSEQQIIHADKIGSEIVRSAQRKLCDNISNQEGKVLDFSRRLIQLSKSEERTCHENTMETVLNAKACEKTVLSFTSDVLAMDEPTKPIPPSRHFTYSRKLSATESSETIIAQLRGMA